MVVRLGIGRWVLVLAYTTATVLAQCAHDHGPRPGRATDHAEAGSDDSHPHVTSHPELNNGSDVHGCAACCFLNGHQAFLHFAPELRPAPIGDIRDGTSQTIAVGERSHNLSYVTWTGRVDGGWLFTTSSIEGGTNTFNPGSEEAFTMILGPVGHEDPPRTPNNPRAHVEDFWTRHRGGANFLFGDGSVRFVKDGISHQVFLSLATRAGGEVISADSY